MHGAKNVSAGQDQLDREGRTPAQRLVAAESPNRIKDHFGRKSRFNPTKSLTALTPQLTQEYEDRFLVELVQNAYDAHPLDTHNGRIHVRLDEFGEQGPVLYVANSGRPFAEKNFDALTNVAQSSKPPGEGIGNKGLGFRSVLQVCDFPEVFSCDPDNPDSTSFNGFCFGFADDAQIRAMVESDEQYRVIAEEFSRYLLPVTATSNDPQLVALRAMGMVTVLRLPLTSPKAVEVARTQVRLMLGSSPPIALFLDRLRMITVEHVDAEGHKNVSCVERLVTDIAVTDERLKLQWIETAGHRYLVASRVLKASEVREVVSEAVRLGELATSWAEWDTDAEVSLAVPVGDSSAPDVPPSLYTYLPMGVPAPLHAHLHAPFHTKIDRLSLNERSTYNAYLIRTAAELAAQVAHLLTTDTYVEVDLASRQGAVADLLAWDTKHLHFFEVALNALNIDLKSSPLIPARRGPETEWAPLNAVWDWDEAGLGFLKRRVIQAHVSLVEPSIGTQRIQRLSALSMEVLLCDLSPDDEAAADWIENVAADMHARSASIATWNRFLLDVATVFAHRNAKALQGRLIVLDQKKTLRRTGPRSSTEGSRTDPTVFLPPQPRGSTKTDEEEELSKVPKGLQQSVCYLHEGIKTRTRSGRTWQRTPVAELFHRGDLVERFELSPILGHLERLLAGKVSDGTCRQALSWVYSQERASRSNISELHKIGLRVPTPSGWIPSNQAVFSLGWDTPRAATMAALVKECAGASASIHAMGDGAILRPTEWPFRLRDQRGFRDFLSRAGVQDGLQPLALRSKTPVKMNGQTFSATVVGARFDLTDAKSWGTWIRQQWVAHLVGPQTPYTGDLLLWTLPGQDAFDSLSDRSKGLLASAILESLADWPAHVWQYGFRRRSPHHAYKPDPQFWPSPLAAFLSTAAWLPMANARLRDDRYFVPVSEAWSFDETTGETAPRFARLMPMEHRRILATSPPANARLRALGLRTWNNTSSAAHRLAELAGLLADGDVVESELAHVRRAIAKAWSELVSTPSARLAGVPDLVVERKSRVTILGASSETPPDVFVHDVVIGLVAQVLETSGQSLLVADPEDGPQIVKALAGVSGFRVRPTSTVDAQVVLDGQALIPAPTIGRSFLEIFDPWLVRVLLAVLDLQSSRFRPITDKVLHDAEARLRRMRIVTGEKIELEVDGHTLPALGRLARCVHLDNSEAPLLVLNGTDVDLPSWRAIELLSDDLADLLGQSTIGSEFRAAALAFQRSDSPWREPTAVEIADVLRQDVEKVVDVLRSLRTSTDHLRFLLSPLVGVILGLQAAERIDSEVLSGADELRSLLMQLIGDDRGAELFGIAEQSESIDDMRRATRSALGPLNTILLALGRPPLHFPDAHRVVVASFINEHRIDLLADLRRRFLAQFEAREGLSGYTLARDFRGFAPSPDWLHDFEEPTEAMVREHLEAWLETQGQPTCTATTLGSIDDVRAANQLLVNSCLERLADLVRAWSGKFSVVMPVGWDELQIVRDNLSSSGCLDFVSLSEFELIGWLAILGLWPEGMPTTSDPDTLGVPAPRGENGFPNPHPQNHQRRERTELPFGGRTFDTATEELRLLIKAVEESADEAFLSGSKTPTKLVEVKVHKGRSAGGGGRSGGPTDYAGRKLTNEQKAAIGLAGEALAYKWLQSAYPETTPDSWVSENRRFILGGHTGDDRLGYDFKIARKSETLFFEVKATTTDVYAFDIGESELRFARAARLGCYRIIFIRSILNLAERERLILPNPLEPAQAATFAQINQGMRLRFEPQTNRMP